MAAAQAGLRDKLHACANKLPSSCPTSAQGSCFSGQNPYVSYVIDFSGFFKDKFVRATRPAIDCDITEHRAKSELQSPGNKTKPIDSLRFVFVGLQTKTPRNICISFTRQQQQQFIQYKQRLQLCRPQPSGSGIINAKVLTPNL